MTDGFGSIRVIGANLAPPKSAAVRAWARRRGVLQVFNLPRTPLHNAAAERAIGEHKREAGIRGPRARSRSSDRRSTAAMVVSAAPRTQPAPAADSITPDWTTLVKPKLQTARP